MYSAAVPRPSELPEVLGMSDRVVVMQGERIVDFDITEALEMPRVFDEKLYKISQDLSR